MSQLNKGSRKNIQNFRSKTYFYLEKKKASNSIHTKNHITNYFLPLTIEIQRSLSFGLLRMMVDSDHIEFRCRWIYKLLMWEVENWNCACKMGDLCRCILTLELMMRTKTRLTSHLHEPNGTLFQERFAICQVCLQLLAIGHGNNWICWIGCGLNGLGCW
jgi:hypothetical protein